LREVSDRSVVILAGGEGRRMGGANKALLELGGQTFLDRQLREAEAISDDVVVVVAGDSALADRLAGDGTDRGRRVRFVSDRYPGEGPLAGVHAGFAAARRPYVWLLGCDQPYASASVALWLLERLRAERTAVQAVVPRIGGREQPLHAVYRKEAGEQAERLLVAGERRLRAWLEQIGAAYAEEEDFRLAGHSLTFAHDIDTPEQYEEACLRELGKPPVRALLEEEGAEESAGKTNGTSGQGRLARRHALQPEEARRMILETVGILPTEQVSLHDAWGRRLAEPLFAPMPFPPFRRSGMDGYAVRADDLAGAEPGRPVELTVLESLPGGTAPKHAVGPGQATRIMTGGMVPEGADAVVMLEMTENGEHEGAPIVRIGRAVTRGTNVAEIGCEIGEGALLLPAGRSIGAGETALLAACGCAFVSVARRPRVAILSTGSELLEPHEPLAPAKIRNSNAPMLAALVREAGGEPLLLGQVPDDAGAAEALLRRALGECDVLVTSGGVSVGDYDIMVDVLARPDVELLFNKVAMRPGSPTTAARIGDKLVVALSGNPGACFVGFHLFVAPAIGKLLGADTEPTKFQAYLGADFPKVNAFRRYIRARTELRDGTVWATPTGDDKSSLMTTIVGADILIEIPPLKEGLAKGHPVTVWKLGL